MQQIDTLPPYCSPSGLTGEMLVVDTTGDSCAMAGDSTAYCCVYDSIFTPVKEAPPVVRKSIFTHHELAVQHNHEIDIHHEGSPGWFFGFIILSIFLICTYLRRKQIDLVTLLQSAIDHRAMGRMLRDTNLTHAPDQAPIALLMLLPVTLVSYFFFFPHPENMWNDMLQYILLYAASIVIYFTRNGIFRFIGNAFNNSDSMHVYLSSNYIYHLLYAIAATAMAFFVCYTDAVGTVFFYILAGVLALLFTIRLVRGLKLILTFSKTPKVYLFYYLCILEIVPIIVITKVVVSY
jgi:hypothetical protein